MLPFASHAALEIFEHLLSWNSRSENYNQKDMLVKTSQGRVEKKTSVFKVYTQEKYSNRNILYKCNFLKGEFYKYSKMNCHAVA